MLRYCEPNSEFYSYLYLLEQSSIVLQLNYLLFIDFLQGKSLSIICGALKWLKSSKDRQYVLANDEESSSNNNNIIIDNRNDNNSSTPSNNNNRNNPPDAPSKIPRANLSGACNTNDKEDENTTKDINNKKNSLKRKIDNQDSGSSNNNGDSDEEKPKADRKL